MRAALWLSLLPAKTASACAVCFGLGTGNVAKAISVGILMLLGSVLSVLAVLVIAVVRIERHRVLAEEAAAHLS